MEDVVYLRDKETIMTGLISMNNNRAESYGVRPHINPDIAGFLVDDEGLNGISKSLQALLPAGLVFRYWNEELWRQQD